MSFERPTLPALIERIDADLESRLSKQQLRRSNARVYSRVIAGVVHGLYGYTEWLSKQLFVDTAETEFLDRYASLYGASRKQASKASGNVKFTFSGDVVEVRVPGLLDF